MAGKALGSLARLCTLLGTRWPVPNGPARYAAVVAAVLMSLTVSISGLAEPATESRVRAPEATVRLGNREIVELRAIVLGRPPAQRAQDASRALAEIARRGESGPITVRSESVGVVVMVGEKGVLLLAPGDVGEGDGQSLAVFAGRVVGNLQTALAEAGEQRSWRGFLAGLLRALLVSIALGAVLWILEKLRVWASSKLRTVAEFLAERLDAAGIGFASARFFTGLARRLVWLLTRGAAAVATYVWLAVVLRSFAYTRPWGEQLRGYLASGVKNLGIRALEAVPDLAVVAVIVILTRFFIRLADSFFEAVESGRVRASQTLAETVAPTRRITHAALWIFALIMAYPYLPGSGTEAFKGVSVFVGVMISLGSTTIVGQALSGLMILYARLFKEGDYIRVGDVEGIVTGLGIFVTRIQTPWNDEVALSNSVVAAATTRNFSRSPDAAGPLLSTRVTIGYDTPWRQVEALLCLAASRTGGLKKDPAPFVRQWSLGDFYVEYELNARIERPEYRVPVMAALHAAIQDAFNEHGVQIMSPHYVLDPRKEKVVPREKWFEPPAVRSDPAAKSGGNS
ncbi:MAG: hypothetical protein DIJKHBIC_00305 [Thermoanaerobaculia bacterium]|nr:hypothetical protein [Thermoanaerobaculia bacterium]